MPELPEVETIRRGIQPLVTGRSVTAVLLRCRNLRWQATDEELASLVGQQVKDVERRAKYLLIHFTRNWLVLHMGMTGTLRVLAESRPPGRHDHFDLVFDRGACLRFHDPRKFGGVLWFRDDPRNTGFFAACGPEPFADEVDGAYFYHLAKGKSLAVKNFIMDQKIVAGVGNIYANEALFLSGIHPARPAGRISLKRFNHLAENIRLVLARAIEAGGTTIRDFVGNDGQPGYFALELQVYGREGQACVRCGRPVTVTRIGQRSTFFCRKCQT